MATRRRTPPMLKRLHDPRGMRVGGVIAWKLMIGIAVGVGALVVAGKGSFGPATTDSRSSDTPVTAVAVATPVPNPEARVAPEAEPSNESPSDPFAGVDVHNDSVLKLIAGIEDKSRTRLAAPRSARPATVASASDPRSPSAPRVESAERRPVTAAPDQAVPAQPAPILAAAPAAENSRAVQPVVAAELPASAPPTRTADAGSPVQSSDRAATANGAVIAPPPANPPANANERVLVAALGNAAPAPSIVAPLKVTNRALPVFPPEAIRAGVQAGRVVARVTIQADGHVSGAQILSASPAGFFERESRRALAGWRYEPPGRETTADVELVFNRE